MITEGVGVDYRRFSLALTGAAALARCAHFCSLAGARSLALLLSSPAPFSGRTDVTWWRVIRSLLFSLRDPRASRSDFVLENGHLLGGLTVSRLT